MRANFLAEYSEIQVENSRRIYTYTYDCGNPRQSYRIARPSASNRSINSACSASDLSCVMSIRNLFASNQLPGCLPCCQQKRSNCAISYPFFLSWLSLSNSIILPTNVVYLIINVTNRSIQQMFLLNNLITSYSIKIIQHTIFLIIDSALVCPTKI